MSIINNLLTRVTLSILLSIELVAILVFTHIIYNGVIDTTIYIVIIVTIVVFDIYLWTKARLRVWLNKLVIIQVLLLITFPIIFWVFKPQYTFQQAKSVVVQDTDFLNGFKVQGERYVNLKMYNSPNPFLRYAYLLKVSNGNGTENYIIFDPIRGEYKFFK